MRSPNIWDPNYQYLTTYLFEIIIKYIFLFLCYNYHNMKLNNNKLIANI